jgi:hypothetical protein
MQVLAAQPGFLAGHPRRLRPHGHPCRDPIGVGRVRLGDRGDPAVRLRKLQELRDAGLLTQETAARPATRRQALLLALQLTDDQELPDRAGQQLSATRARPAPARTGSRSRSCGGTAVMLIAVTDNCAAARGRARLAFSCRAGPPLNSTC